MKLNKNNLQRARVQTPDYSLDDIKPGIFHLGLGAFHRSHQAVYIDAILSRDPAWGIVGASLRSTDIVNRLSNQNNLYALEVRDTDMDAYQIIGSITSTLSAENGTSEIIDAMTRPQLRMVTLTVTENGYLINPTTGKLDRELPDVEHDRLNPSGPKTAPGIIAKALQMRRDKGLRPFTVLSCDNLSDNGKVLQQSVVELAQLWNPSLAVWIEDNVTFPSSMVDRITPATTEKDQTRIAAAIGLDDACPVTTEPYTQWVIEDQFCAGRPELEGVGVTFVSDVRAYEEMKLRLLNGSHSALAYLGSLAGYETVSQAIADPWLRDFVQQMWCREIRPQLDNRVRLDPSRYCEELVTRFSNSAMVHRLSQIARDGSKKLPNRIVPVLEKNVREGKEIDQLVTVLVSWILYLKRLHENDLLDRSVDPAYSVVADALRRFNGNNMIINVLKNTSVCRDELLKNSRVSNLLIEKHQQLTAKFK